MFCKTSRKLPNAMVYIAIYEINEIKEIFNMFQSKL